MWVTKNREKQICKHDSFNSYQYFYHQLDHSLLLSYFQVSPPSDRIFHWFLDSLIHILDPWITVYVFIGRATFCSNRQSRNGESKKKKSNVKQIALSGKVSLAVANRICKPWRQSRGNTSATGTSRYFQ